MPNDDAKKAAQFGAVLIDLEKVAFTSALLRHVPAALVHKHQALPLRFFPGSSRACLRVAINDPSDLDLIDELHHQLGYEIEVCVANAQQLRTFIKKLYPLGT